MNKKDWMQTLLSLGLVLPGVAQAIGLGNLVVLSGPGEPFRAEISIHSAHPNQLADLRAQLAGSSAYGMIHLPLAAVTQNWQFSVRAGDEPAILISSPMPLAPGATPFLVQLDWAGGQMVREYQAYPGTYNVPQRTALPTPAMVASRIPTAQMPMRNSNGWSSTDQYGPVPMGRSLYQIAQQLNRNPRVSQQQAMAALFKANPMAFLQGDPSRLVAGVVLKVPGIQEVRALNPLQAATLLHRKEQLPAVTPSAKQVTAKTAVATPVPSTANASSPGGIATALSLTSAPVISAAKTAVVTPVVNATGTVAPVVSNPDSAKIEGLQDSLHGVEARLALAQQQLASQAVEISKMSRNTASSFPPLLWVSLGGNLLLLLLFIWMYRRQERAAGRQREISSKLTAMSTAPRNAAPVVATPAPVTAPVLTPVSVPASVPEVLPEAVAELSGTSSAAPEPSIVAAPRESEQVEMEEDHDSFDVDPLEQADLYQTYGKTEQAINVLQEALESNPRRREFYIRLLALYAETDRRGDFLDLAERIRSRFGPNNADWQEIAGKGRELFPGNALFVEEKNEAEGSAVAPASTPELESTAGNLEQPASSDSEKLDFDFGSWGNTAEQVSAEEEPAWTDAHQKMLDEMNEQFRALDQDHELGLSLADDTHEMHGDSELAETAASATLAEEPIQQSTKLASAADWDAVGTKLDLAKAYVEMGDSEAARELLEEVRRDGSPEQQSEAEKLLASC